MDEILVTAGKCFFHKNKRTENIYGKKVGFTLLDSFKDMFKPHTCISVFLSKLKKVVP
jgi:hypothetical protein